jgi:hypothetical protein
MICSLLPAAPNAGALMPRFLKLACMVLFALALGAVAAPASAETRSLSQDWLFHSG